MLVPLLLMAGSFIVFYLAVMGTMAQALLLEQEASSQWAQQAAA